MVGRKCLRQGWGNLTDGHEDPMSPPRNPLDLVFDAARALGAETREGAPLEGTVDRLRQGGLDHNMVVEAAENWESLGLARVDRAAGRLWIDGAAVRELEDERPRWAAMRSSPPPPGASPRGQVALLSLFDGTGMARPGMDDLLRMAGAPRALVSSAFCINQR